MKINDNYINDIITYKAYNFHRFLSSCGVLIHKQENGNKVVIMTELSTIDPHYEGVSITNSVESACRELALRYFVNPNNTIYIERYAACNGSSETFDRVFGLPEGPVHWKRMSKAEVDKLLEE